MSKPATKANELKKPKTPKRPDRDPAVVSANAKAYEEHRKSLRPSERRPAAEFGRKDTPGMRAALLDWLRAGVTPARAADECGIARRTAWAWREKDPEFKQQWEEAVAEGIERLEDEARRRGFDGVDRPVFQQGECVGFVREYSDDLLKFVLTARNPARYSKGAQLGGSGNDRPEINFTFSFGNAPPVAAAQVQQTMDGAVSGSGDIQPVGFERPTGPLLVHRSDDEGR